MSYKAEFHDHGDTVHIVLPKQRLIFTSAEYQQALARGKNWKRRESAEKRLAQRRAEAEAATLDWIE